MSIKHFFFASLLPCLVVFVVTGTVVADEKPAAAEKAKESEKETVEVKLRDLKLQLPKSWSKSDLVNNMRLATYDIPSADGDQEKGELAISTFPGGGGEVSANLERWIGQFEAEGRESAIREGKAGENVYYIAEISGTYKKSIGPPVAGRTERKEGYRMLGVILNIRDKGVYFLKLTGPDATVKAQEHVLRETFGAKTDDEKDYEI
jgi:hypothetical protein